MLIHKCRKLNSEYNLELECEELIKLVNQIKQLTICVKLRSFQYKFLMNSIITNIKLKHYKVKDSDLCSFCSLEKETMQHLFYDCKYVQVLWQYVGSKYHCQVQMVDIVTNKVNANPKHPTNTIDLIVKYFIFRTKCQGTRPDKVFCEKYIQNYIEIEECIAKQKNKMNLHKIKWSALN